MEIINLRKSTKMKFMLPSNQSAINSHFTISGITIKLYLYLFILWIIIPKGYTAPSIRHYTFSVHKNLTHFSDDVHNYLMEFGYLPKSDIETGNLRTEEQLKEAIRNLQKFANITVTGVIDKKTRELIRRPRCGVPDQPDTNDFSPDNRERRRRLKRFVVQGAKWDHTDLTWSLVNQTMDNLDAGQVRRILTEALSVWESNSKLTFREVYSEDADIQVLFARRHHGDGYDFDGPGQVLAHAFYPGGGRGGDAHFDEEESWIINSTDSNEGTTLMGVAVHEFGHSLGLGHSSVEDAIMFPWYHGYEANKELPEDDRLAIQTIYGSKETQWGPYYPHRPRTTTTTTTTSTTTTTTTTTTTMRPILRYYPEPPRRIPPVDRDDPRRYPGRRPNDNPRRPSYWDNDRPRKHPSENDPRSDPRYPQNDPRYPTDRNIPENDPRNDPRYPQHDPRYPIDRNTPENDPRYPTDRNTPESDPRNNPRYPQNDPRYPTDRNTPENDPKNDPRYPQNDPRYPTDRNTPENDPRHPTDRNPSGNDPRNDPRYPSNNPRYPINDNPQDRPRYPYNDPRYPETTPRHDKKHHHHHKPYYPHSHSPHYPRYPDPEPTELPPRRYPVTNYPKTEPPKTETPSTHPPTPHPTRHHHSVHTTPKIITHHPRHRDPSKHKPNDYPEKLKPDGCNTDYDAVTIIRGELYIFKDKYLWRINDKGLYAGFPYEISRVWRDLPKDFKRIDAVYENKEQKIVFFIGKQYYVFNSHILEKGYPKPLTNLGLPDTLDKIDAVLIWGWNNKTYFYSGTLYWRFDEDTGKVELDYPRDMSIWNGIGYHIDAAFQYLNGKTYFFKGKGYWEFDDMNMRIHGPQKPSAQRWMSCPSITNESDEPTRRKAPLRSDPSLTTTSSSSPSIISISYHEFKIILEIMPFLVLYYIY